MLSSLRAKDIHCIEQLTLSIKVFIFLFIAMTDRTVKLSITKDENGDYGMCKVLFEDWEIIEMKPSDIVPKWTPRWLVEWMLNEVAKKEWLAVCNVDTEICISEWIETFKNAKVIYDKGYIREQIDNQRPWTFTAREYINWEPWGIYRKFDVYPTKEAREEALGK